MADDEEFGDFSSAFSSNQTTGGGFEADAVVPTSSQMSGTKENYSTAFTGSAQPPEDITFDAFASFPLENGGFADFHSFTPNSSFPPVQFEEGSVPDIPPLPEDLQINIKGVGVGDVISTAEATSSQFTTEQPRSSEPTAPTSTAIDANEFGDFEFSFPAPSGTSHSQTVSSSAATTTYASSHGSQMSEGAIPNRAGNSESTDHRSGNPSQHSSMDVASDKSLSHSFETRPAFNSTSLASEEGFADFNHFAQSVVSQPSKPDQGIVYMSQPPQSAVETTVQSTLSVDQIDDFGSFSSAEDEFRGFEAATTGRSHTTAVKKEPQEGFASSINQLASSDSSKFMISGGAFVLCFSSPNKSHVVDKQVVKLDPNNTSSFDFRSWSTLRRSVDFTVPLYKWDTSHLQKCYYGSIKVDPMLVKKVDSTPLMTMVPAVGQSAAADLMQSFGFEGGLEPTDPHTSIFSAVNEFQRNSDESGPALLDLSLPATPSVESQKDSFTLDADLLSLDLNPSQTEGKRTSIEELLLNERLVVNRTTWMDSELMELGGAEPTRTQTPPTTPPTSANRKTTSLEQQLERLGLDTSKTTQTSTSVTEMSISARLVYDRLPDLSFMISDTLVQNHSYRKC